MHDADLILFHGMKRSGNHAVLDWMMDNVRGIKHFNNVFPLRVELEQPGSFKFPVVLGDVLRKQKRWSDFFAKAPAHTICSIEDWDFGRNYFSGAEHTLNILLLRSAENLFSSRIHKAFKMHMAAYPREFDHVMRRAMNVWVDHVDALLENSGRPDFVGIVFDDWVTKPAYRDAVADRLGFKAVVQPRASRAKEGGGSSFDGHAEVAGTDPSSLLQRSQRLSPTERDLLAQVLADAAIVEAQRKLSAFLQSEKHLKETSSTTDHQANASRGPGAVISAVFPAVLAYPSLESWSSLIMISG